MLTANPHTNRRLTLAQDEESPETIAQLCAEILEHLNPQLAVLKLQKLSDTLQQIENTRTPIIEAKIHDLSKLAELVDQESAKEIALTDELHNLESSTVDDELKEQQAAISREIASVEKECYDMEMTMKALDEELAELERLEAAEKEAIPSPER